MGQCFILIHNKRRIRGRSGTELAIYLDLIWLLNFLFDALLLLLCAVLLKRSFKWWRLLLGAFIGSLIVILLFTDAAPFAEHYGGKLTFSVVMVLVAFGFVRLRYLIESLLTFYFATFTVGGGLMGLHFMFSDTLIFQAAAAPHSASFGDPVSWVFIVLTFPVLFYFSKKRVEGLQTRKVLYDELIPVTIHINGQRVEAKGLIDSGNQLTEPLTKTPVMIAVKELMSEIVPSKLLELTSRLDEDHLYDELPVEWTNRIRFVPYRSVGSSSQLLLALKPDFVTFQYQDEEMKVKRVLVGISPVELSPEKAYECIVHPKMIVVSNVS